MDRKPGTTGGCSNAQDSCRSDGPDILGQMGPCRKHVTFVGAACDANAYMLSPMMRHNNTSLASAVIFGLLLSGCQKERLAEPSSGRTGTTMSMIYFPTEDQYLTYIDAAKTFFSSCPDNPKGEGFDSNYDVDSVALHSEVGRYRQWQSLHLLDSDIITVYSNYIQLLEEGDISEWKSAATEFKDFYYIDDFDHLNLKHTHLISSIINMQGLFIVDDQLFHYWDNELNVYNPSEYSMTNDGLTLRKPATSIVYGSNRDYIPVYDQLHFVGYDQQYQY
ncbi:MAG: hypothetical protein KBH07_09035, partial [Flavobacteriales bacterium]|nr:hypothetical protein [Flavobacteriales bacterium]